MSFYCRDCETIYDEEELIEHAYRNTSSHYVEDNIRCKCGSNDLEDVDHGLHRVVDLMDRASNRLKRL